MQEYGTSGQVVGSNVNLICAVSTVHDIPCGRNESRAVFDISGPYTLLMYSNTK